MTDHPVLPQPHADFLVIEGNIGAGKTTLATRMARDFGRKLILEEFTDNPFLTFFYENPERYAFPVELFFMTERHKQLQAELVRPELFEQGIVADYFFLKTLLFARNNLNDEEFRLFQRLFYIINAAFPKPDLLLYLHRPVDGLLDNIRKRGRSYEQNMDPAYLQSIQQAYFDYFRTNSDIPIVVLDVNQLDFVHDEQDYHKIVQLLQHKFAPGVHHLDGRDL